MIKVSKRYIKRLAPVALAFALIGALAPASANAATVTSVSVSPSDPTAGNASTWTFTLSGATAGAANCLLVYADTSAGFGSATQTPAFTGVPGGASLFTAGTWVNGGQFGSTSATKFTSAGGVTVATGASKTFTLATTNPAAGTYYISIQTFGNVNCTASPIDNGTSTATTTTNTVVSVTVDPTFTFAVNPQASTTVCNGLAAATITSTSTAVGFGHLAAGARAYGVQQLQVTTNAGSGYVVYLHSAAASAPVLKGSGGHTIADSGAAGAVPAAGTAFFGYTTDATGSGLTSAQIATVPINTGNVTVGAGAAGTAVNNCVGFAVGASATTPADTYTSTVVYTAVPTF